MDPKVEPDKFGVAGVMTEDPWRTCIVSINESATLLKERLMQFKNRYIKNRK